MIRPSMLRRIEEIVRYFKAAEDPTIAGAADELGICYDTAKDRLAKAAELGYISRDFHEQCKVKAGRPAERAFYPKAGMVDEDSTMRKAVWMRKKGATLLEIAEATGRRGKSSAYYLLRRAMDEGLITPKEYET